MVCTNVQVESRMRQIPQPLTYQIWNSTPFAVQTTLRYIFNPLRICEHYGSLFVCVCVLLHYKVHSLPKC